VQVDQVGRQHVHAEHAGEGLSVGVRGFGQPFGSVVDNGSQAVGVGFQLGDEREDPRFSGEVGKYRGGAQVAQCLHAWAFAAVTEDHRMAVFEQTLRTVQADTLAGTGDEDRSCGRGHERLASR
jgi:hypothetical protein